MCFSFLLRWHIFPSFSISSINLVAYPVGLGGQEGSKVGKKGSDKGIDGIMNFVDDATGKPKRVIVQVKSGHVKSGDIRDLVGTVKRENAAIGVFITLEEPSKDRNGRRTSYDFLRVVINIKMSS